MKSLAVLSALLVLPVSALAQGVVQEIPSDFGRLTFHGAFGPGDVDGDGLRDVGTQTFVAELCQGHTYRA